jgi:hypothetical protein
LLGLQLLASNSLRPFHLSGKELYLCLDVIELVLKDEVVFGLQLTVFLLFNELNEWVLLVLLRVLPLNWRMAMALLE